MRRQICPSSSTTSEDTLGCLLLWSVTRIRKVVPFSPSSKQLFPLYPPVHHPLVLLPFTVPNQRPSFNSATSSPAMQVTLHQTSQSVWVWESEARAGLVSANLIAAHLQHLTAHLFYVCLTLARYLSLFGSCCCSAILICSKLGVLLLWGSLWQSIS